MERRRFLATAGAALGAVVAGGLAAGPGAGPAAAAAPRRYVLGRSYQDRAIEAYRLGRADAPSCFLVLGCMHGDEPVGDRIALNRLLQRSAPRGVQLWVVPTMNPDGVAAGTRTNARGVDLNRNFPSADWRLQGKGTDTYSGASAASERETRLMVKLLDDLRPRTVVSIHQPLACVDYSGGERAVTDWLASHLRLPAKKLGASGGNLTTWFNDAYGRRTAVTLELGRPVGAQRRDRVADVLVRLAAHRRT